MTTMYADLASIRAHALRLDPVRFLLTLCGLLPMLLGYVARLVWMVPAFLWASAAWGWTAADKQVKAREREARH